MDAMTPRADGLTLTETRAALLARGLREVRTLAGWCPVAEWTPYGADGDEFAAWMRYELREAGSAGVVAVADLPPPGVDAGVCGRWPVR